MLGQSHGREHPFAALASKPLRSIPPPTPPAHTELGGFVFYEAKLPNKNPATAGLCISCYFNFTAQVVLLLLFTFFHTLYYFFLFIGKRRVGLIAFYIFSIEAHPIPYMERSKDDAVTMTI